MSKQKIEDSLKGNRYNEAIKLYEMERIMLAEEGYFRLAKAYFCRAQYQKCLDILRKIKLEDKWFQFQGNILEFKCKFFQGVPSQSILNKLEDLTKGQDFSQGHRKVITQLRDIYNYKDNINKGRWQLKKQGLDFEELYNRQMADGGPSFQGIPVYLISTKWMQRWRRHVFLAGNQMQEDSPGVISHFQVLDHLYFALQDPRKEKQYTNRYLLPSQYSFLTKNCWKYLQQRYGGFPIARYKICNSYRKDDYDVEVKLIQLMLMRSSDKANNYKNKYLVQVSKKDFWKRVQDKLCKIWGKGRIWKWKNQQVERLKAYSPLEEQNILDETIYMFQLMDNNRWQFGDSQQCNFANIQNCGNCGKNINLKFCECKLIKYCNMECMSQHRPIHHKKCQKKQQISSEDTDLNEIVLKYNIDGDQQFGGKKGLIGLKNLGNTCFMNSGIQCLSNCKELTQYFMSSRIIKDLNSKNNLGSGGQVACAYSKLIRNIWGDGMNKNEELSPWEFKKAISKFSPQFQGNNQHDSQQFMNLLLDCLHEDVNLVKEKGTVFPIQQNKEDEQLSRLSYQNYAKRNKSHISDLLMGQFKSKIICQKCKKISISFDPFFYLPLPVPSKLEIEIYLVKINLEQSPLNFKIKFFSHDTIKEVIQIITRNTKTDPKNFKIWQINSQFKQIREFTGNIDDPAQILKTVKDQHYIFCYEYPHETSKETVHLIKYYNMNNVQEIISYPRYIALRENESYNKIFDMLFKSVERFMREPLNIYSAKELLEFKIYKGIINVWIKNIGKQISTCRKFAFEQKDDHLEQNNIYDCLDLFVKEERLDNQNSWFCTKCRRFLNATKKMDIYKTNKILILGFKRFQKERKIKTKISFPIEKLNLERYVLDKKQKQDSSYELFAVCNHYGSLQHGHYTAFCKNFLTNDWHEFNDNKVTKLREDEIITANAYVLFYRRITI